MIDTIEIRRSVKNALPFPVSSSGMVLGNRRVYIAGKITGESYVDVVKKFALAEAFLRRTKCVPVSPLKKSLVLASWKECMRVCLLMLRDCDAILLLPDWENSRGAKIEKWFAERYGKTVLVSLNNYSFLKTKQMENGFHYKNGLWFTRNADHSVTITQMKTAMADEKEVLFKTTIDENGWASIIASVSSRGESDGRFYKALEWHNK